MQDDKLLHDANRFTMRCIAYEPSIMIQARYVELLNQLTDHVDHQAYLCIMTECYNLGSNAIGQYLDSYHSYFYAQNHRIKTMLSIARKEYT